MRMRGSCKAAHIYLIKFFNLLVSCIFRPVLPVLHHCVFRPAFLLAHYTLLYLITIAGQNTQQILAYTTTWSGRFEGGAHGYN